MKKNQNDFTHLHVHTEYSLLDSTIRIDPLLDRAKKFGMKAVAITDHGTMFGVMDFYKKAKKRVSSLSSDVSVMLRPNDKRQNPS